MAFYFDELTSQRQLMLLKGDISPPQVGPLKPSPVYDAYWKLAAERQRIFFRRFDGELPPWTSDAILREFKFTNAYRASDRVSQYLIRRVIYRDDLPSDVDETAFRILLFKTFNRIETWELLERSVGQIRIDNFDFRKVDRVLTKAMAKGTRIYSAAYIMPSAGTFGHSRKHSNHLVLIGRMLSERLPERLTEAKSMEESFNLLRGFPTIGNFLAYQYSIDINYSEVTSFSESEFVMPGPGAIDGIRKCFRDTAGYSGADVIRFMVDRQEREFERLGLCFKSLWGRRLQLIDCQNLFCEVDKYARVAYPKIGGVSGRVKIKQKFKPLSNPIDYWYPPKWQINAAIS